MIRFLKIGKLKILFICCCLIISILFPACRSGENQRQSQETNQPVSVETGKSKQALSENIIKQLEKTAGIIQYIEFLKKSNASKVSDLTPPAKFESATDRKKMLMRFGILCFDAAYLKIIAEKPQLPEYERLYQKYIGELNLQQIIKLINDAYLPALAAGQINESTLDELSEKWRLDKKTYIDKTKETDEEFLVYSTFGAFIEFANVSLKSFAAAPNDNGAKLTEFMKNNEFAYYALIDMLSSVEEYSEYSLKILPAVEIIVNSAKTNNGIITKENLKKVTDIFNQTRSEILK